MTIDNATLHIYIELLTDDVKDALRRALKSDNRGGLEYRGHTPQMHLPHHLRVVGIPEIRWPQFVSGGYLSPLGRRLAELIEAEAA